MQDTVETQETKEHPFLSMPKEPWKVQCYENGKWIGGLTPDGRTARKVLFMAMLERERAEEIAAKINSNPPFPGATAKAVRF